MLVLCVCIGIYVHAYQYGVTVGNTGHKIFLSLDFELSKYCKGPLTSEVGEGLPIHCQNSVSFFQMTILKSVKSYGKCAYKLACVHML